MIYHALSLVYLLVTLVPFLDVPPEWSQITKIVFCIIITSSSIVEIIIVMIKNRNCKNRS